MCEGGGQRLSSVGAFVTVLYLLALTIIIFLLWPEFSELKPNEWGDFLGGSLGPLAIFWLVLGFFQQGAELRNSVESLKLQTEELRSSVQQQAALVKVTEQQHQLELADREERIEEATKKSFPYFIVISGGGSSSSGLVQNNFLIVNRGADAKSVSITNNIKDGAPVVRQDFRHNSEMAITIISEYWAKDWTVGELSIRAVSLEGRSMSQKFDISNAEIRETHHDIER